MDAKGFMRWNEEMLKKYGTRIKSRNVRNNLDDYDKDKNR